MSTLERAIAIAAEAHAGQTDKGGAPYILHPLRVMLRARESGAPIAAIAAVLHDVIEDCPDWPAGRLASAGFGETVLEALDALTRRAGEAYDDFIARCGANAIARIVKLADLEDNLDLSRIGNPSENDIARIERYVAAHAALSA